MAEPLPLWPRLLALALPAGLLGGALISQYVFGLFPCEMCHWQRWPHYAALIPALGALLISNRRIQRPMLILTALLVAVSGVIGAFHAGVEYGWWEGLTQCATTAGGASLEDLLNAPVIRCDVAPWTLAGISLAGDNALISVGGAAMVLFGMRKSA